MDQALNPFPWFRMMRESTPVYFNSRNKMWSVFRYGDVQRVLSDHTSFSSQIIDSNQPLDASIVNTDPPRHRQLRSLASQAFTPRAIAQLTPRISEIVHELLDHVVSRGRMEVIDDLSYPLPALLMAELLGVPLADRASFNRSSDQVILPTSSIPQDPQEEMIKYSFCMIEHHFLEPPP